MTDLQRKLNGLSDQKYADFQAKLIPGIGREKIIGIRVPVLRKFAKDWKNESEKNHAVKAEIESFLESLPHDFYEENLLHGFLLGQMKDYEECMRMVEIFLPYVDNWAVCDTMGPKSFKKHRQNLLEKIKIWCKSQNVYTVRFGLGMLMSHFLDEDFSEEYLELACSVRSQEYYVNMMQAWYFATALAKQWDSAVSFLEDKRLEKWVHNKTIQKAIESYRITDEQKQYLRGLKIKN